MPMRTQAWFFSATSVQYTVHMTAALISVFVFLQQYIIPIIFAIGVICFLYGVVNSFMIERPDVGHPFLLRSFVLFSIALLAYGALSIFTWLMSIDYTPDPDDSNLPNTGAEFERGRSLLPTPNAPSGNE